jgi:hypothetical protein
MAKILMKPPGNAKPEEIEDDPAIFHPLMIQGWIQVTPEVKPAEPTALKPAPVKG